MGKNYAKDIVFLNKWNQYAELFGKEVGFLQIHIAP